MQAYAMPELMDFTEKLFSHNINYSLVFKFSAKFSLCKLVLNRSLKSCYRVCTALFLMEEDH